MLAGLGGCSAGSTTPPADTTVDPPPVVVSSPPPPGETVDAATVTVHTRVDVPASQAVRALVAFVKAHAESLNSGKVTRSLSSVTTATELARQQRVVDFAVSMGYVVPTAPVVRVVSVVRQTAALEMLAVCFWLPSTEYVDERTGRPPNGPVPRAWAPAVATVRLSNVRLANVTWAVDNLEQPGNETTIRCGSDP